MNQFSILVDDRPGALASICEKLSVVNIEAIASELRSGKKALIRVVTNDESTTRDILRKEHLEFTEEEILSVELIDQPGALGKMARKLANNGVNLKSIYILGKKNGKTVLAISTDKNKLSKKLVGGYP